MSRIQRKPVIVVFDRTVQNRIPHQVVKNRHVDSVQILMDFGPALGRIGIDFAVHGLWGLVPYVTNWDNCVPSYIPKLFAFPIPFPDNFWYFTWNLPFPDLFCSFNSFFQSCPQALVDR